MGPAPAQPLARLRRALAAGLCTTAALVLGGWAFGVRSLQSVHPSFTTMKPWTAVAFALSGVALVASRRAVRLLGIVVAGLGGINLVEIAIGQQTGFGRLLFAAQVVADNPARPGQMAPATSVGFVLTGIGLVGLVLDRRRLVSGVVLAVGSIAGLALIGYLYGASSLYTVGAYSSMALPTAVSFLVIATGLTVSLPGHRTVRLLLDRGLAGHVSRRLLPLAVLVPLTAGWVRLWAGDQGWFDVQFGVSLLVISWVVSELVVSTGIGTYLLHAESERQDTWEQLVEARDRLAERVDSREAELGEIARVAPVGLFRTDADGSCTWVNDRWCELSGLGASEAVGAGWSGALHPDDRARVFEEWAAAVERGSRFELRYRFLRPDGSIVHVAGSASPAPGGWLGAVADISAEVDAFEARALFEASFVSSPVATAILDGRGRVLGSNPALADLLRTTAAHLAQGRLGRFLHDDDRAVVDRVGSAVVRGERPQARLELRLLTADGQPLWADVSFAAIPGQDRLLVKIIDVTARRLAEERLTAQTLHDPLTGLPNRLLVSDRLTEALARADRSGSTVALLFCDLDRFKVVNDSLGHAAGDQVLVATAARLRGAVRPADVVARMGGDEFVVLCEDADAEVAASVAERIRDALTTTLIVNDRPVQVGASVGIAVGTGADTAADLLRDADTAMYLAKDRGRNRYELFDDRLRQSALRRLDLETELRSHRGIHAVFQAVVDLTTGRVDGAEALLRRTDERGVPTPVDELLAVAEESGLIRSIGTEMLTRSLEALAGWQAAGLDLDVAVNVSARQLGYHDFIGVVQRLLGATGVSPHRLVLELTESALSDAMASAARDLRGLRALGVRIAIDDFGTGWSSLERLKAFPVDILKIDRSFVAGLGANETDDAIVTGILRLARSLGLATVAEGVETTRQLHTLTSLGCDRAQGFLLHRPGSAEELGDLARAPVPAIVAHDLDIRRRGPSARPSTRQI